MKLYALMNWKEREPKITALCGLPIVATEKRLVELGWEAIKKSWPENIKVEIVEFESKEIICHKT